MLVQLKIHFLEIVGDEIIYVLSKDSDLVRCLKDYVNVLGEGEFSHQQVQVFSFAA